MEIIQLKQTDGDLSALIHKMNLSNYCFKPIIGTDSMKIKRNVQVFDKASIILLKYLMQEIYLVNYNPTPLQVVS